MGTTAREKELLAKVAELEEEIQRLKTSVFHVKERTVNAPEEIFDIFASAQNTVQSYFSDFSANPERASIEAAGERYVLLRASALSFDFLNTIQNLYSDRGPVEAMRIGKNFLFDMAHVIGMNDARAFGDKMQIENPLAHLAAGPVLFSHFGWAFVDILPESSPTPDENYFLLYHHHHSFEADSWLRSGQKVQTPICIMNAGYSSGWCEESFGIAATAIEISCRARGDKNCTFIMAPPSKIREHLERYMNEVPDDIRDSVVYDIPTFFERKQVEENLHKAKKSAEESTELKAMFLANMSHEIRTPLNGVIGMTDLLLESGLNPEQQELALDAREAGESLLRIVKDILDFSKIDAGKIDLSYSAFSLNELIIALETLFSNSLATKQISFSTSIDQNIPELVVGDSHRIRQILVNLIHNAVKFTTPNGTVSLRIEQTSSSQETLMILFEVIDSGKGIAPEKIESIFEPFAQEDSSIAKNHGGSGLGLSICSELVKLMDGEIQVSSVPNEGSTFSFTLPLSIAS